jgi:hypothetical protein
VSLARYSAFVIGAGGVSLAALRLALAAETWKAVVAAAVLAVVNAIAAFALVTWASGRSTVAFFQAILGGTLARMVLLLGGALTAILALGFARVPFLLSLVAYFAVFLALEMAVVHRLKPSAAGAPR